MNTVLLYDIVIKNVIYDNFSLHVNVEYEIFYIDKYHKKVFFRGYVGEHHNVRFFDIHVSFIAERYVKTKSICSYFMDLLIVVVLYLIDDY